MKTATPVIPEKPILFSGEMVRRLLDGFKTQTRRVIKLQPTGEYPIHFDAEDSLWYEDGGCWKARCPYGSAGTRLWVREAWCECEASDADEHGVFYRGAKGIAYKANWGGIDDVIRWKPSIHMPRRASRITLEIVDVRVERLNEISEGDAAAEGVGRIELQPAPLLGEHNGRKMYGHPMTSTHEHAFRVLWESINGAGSWEANPWVWVLEFKKC